MACQLGDLEAVKILVKGGADVNLFDTGEENPLIMATASAQKEIVSYLLGHGSKVNLNSPLSGDSALFRAQRRRSFDMLTLLIQGGADVNLANQGGDTPLMIASLDNDHEMVKFLKTMGAKFKSPREEFFCAASQGDVDTLRRILVVDIKSHSWLYRHIFEHLGAGKQRSAASLVNQSYGYGVTPLMAAAGNGQTAAVEAIEPPQSTLPRMTRLAIPPGPQSASFMDSDVLSAGYLKSIPEMS